MDIDEVGIPGVDIDDIPDPPGVVDDPPGVVDDPPGMEEDEEHSSDSHSDSDNDDPDWDAQRTQNGRVVQSTQDEDYVYNTVGVDTLQVVGEPDGFVFPKTKIKRLREDEYHNFICALEYIENSPAYHDFLINFAMTQMSIREGLKRYWADGETSLMKEINNLVTRYCFGEFNYESLTAEEKRKALLIPFLLPLDL